MLFGSFSLMAQPLNAKAFQPALARGKCFFISREEILTMSWSADNKQHDFMTASSMAVNKPSLVQYQLNGRKGALLIVKLNRYKRCFGQYRKSIKAAHPKHANDFGPWRYLFIILALFCINTFVVRFNPLLKSGYSSAKRSLNNVEKSL